MSLQVWLPLTKDLRQQGLANIGVVNHNTTLNVNGKLGSCYYFNGSQQWIQFNSALGNFYNNDWSVACWLKPTDSTRGVIISEFNGSGSSNVAIELSATRLVRLYWDGTPDIYFSTAGAVPLNIWTHLVMTKKGREIKVYFDGNLKQTYTHTSDFSTKTSACQPRIGDDYRGDSSNTVSYQGYMNDFRMYNHCLSPMEVKELAKGLVLHFPLNRNGWGQENLVMNTGIMPVHSSTLKGFRVSGTGTLSNVTYNNLPVGSGAIRLTNNTSAAASCGMAQDGLSGFIAGKKYSQSCWVRANANNTITNFYLQPIWISSSQTTGADSRRYTLTTEWQQIKAENLTLNGEQASTYSSGYCYCTIPANGWIEVCGMKVEESPIVTPWCPNSSDALGTTLNINGTIEYDCSGYGNNGTRTGTFSWTSDTPKYLVSTHIGSTSSKIHISNFPTSGFGDSYSFAWWGKNTAFGNPMFWGFSDGVRLNGMHTGRLWNTGDSGNNPLYNIGTTTQVAAPSVNTWHHYVMTGNGSKCYVYLDGELWAEAKTYKSISGTSIYINGWDNSVNYSYNNMNIVDFRIYVTALSATDVAELYKSRNF